MIWKLNIGSFFNLFFQPNKQSYGRNKKSNTICIQQLKGTKYDHFILH